MMTLEDSPELELALAAVEQIRAGLEVIANVLDQVKRSNLEERGPKSTVTAPPAKRGGRRPSAPRFSEATSAERLIVDFVTNSGRAWRAVDLIRHFRTHTNLAAYVSNPDTTVYQALSRAARQGRLTKPAQGIYAPAPEEDDQAA